MLKINFPAVAVNGYDSGETDFTAAFAQACVEDPNLALTFESNVMEPLTTALQNADQCGFFEVIGCSDRVDTPGLTHQQRFDQEFNASRARALSASDAVFAMANVRVGGNLGADWSEVLNVAEHFQGVGAGLLTIVAENPPESDRRQNRGVFVSFVQYVP